MSSPSPKDWWRSGTQRAGYPSRATEKADLCTATGKDVAFECAEQRGLPKSKSGTGREAGVVTKDYQVSIPISDTLRLALKSSDSLRGAKATNAVVKEFWIACRGAEFAYA